jgi:hypothetical protein
MVYNIQSYRVCGLCPSSGILNCRKHNVSDTGSSKRGLSKGPNRVGVSLASSEDGNRSSFRNVLFSRV